MGHTLIVNFQKDTWNDFLEKDNWICATVKSSQIVQYQSTEWKKMARQEEEEESFLAQSRTFQLFRRSRCFWFGEIRVAWCTESLGCHGNWTEQ